MLIRIPFLIFLIQTFFLLAFAQDIQILPLHGELVPMNKHTKNRSIEHWEENKVDSKESIAFTSDTLSYKYNGNFNTDFGFNSSDVMLQYFQSPSDMIVRAIGFSCSDDSGATITDVHMELYRLNWEFDDLMNIQGPKNIGVYASSESAVPG